MGQNNLVDRMMCKLKLRDTIAEIDESAEDIKGTLGKDTLLEETQGTNFRVHMIPPNTIPNVD